MMDVELVARSSLSSLHRTVDDAFVISPENLEDWTWSNLRKTFKFKSLENLYIIYRRRIENGYMSLFILLQLMLGIAHCIVLVSMLDIRDVLVDLITIGIENALLFPIIALLFRSELIVKKTYLPVYFSCMIIALMVISDLAVAVYYTLTCTNDSLSFRPVYATHTLLVCYIFLPLSNNVHAFILGITASFCYVAGLLLITYRNDPNYGIMITTDIMYYTCVNCLGLYFRFMNEVMIRRSFLDRRKCVESTLRLNYEKDQEEQLTRSILPPHFAAKIKKNFRDICRFIEEHKQSRHRKGRSSTSISKDLYVEIHENVSILYADVVNFSGLTVTLPVTKLVETLNDLFGSFDEASERHNVLRIKFLGDCYYCVSGVPNPNPQHAKSCVDLGLNMISIINDVRTRVQIECGVDVNMRIGVHSGKIISGILGTNKWQYDVWSRDVIIANKMEQTGEAGKVHITQQTLNLLDADSYNCKPVTKLNDEVLLKYGICQSYLISPKVAFNRSFSMNSNVSFMFENSDNQLAAPVHKHYPLRSSQADVFACSFRRRTHFMDSCLRDYHLMLKEADAEMEKAIEQMPLSKWEQWCKWEHINPFFLTFSHWSWEVPYLREPDPLIKFYIACTGLVLIFMGFIIFFPIITISDDWQLGDTTTICFGVALVFIIILIPFTWTQFLWCRYKEMHDESENSIMQQPRNKILNFFYQTSVKVIWNVIIRVALFFIIIAITGMTAVFNILLECEYDVVHQENNITESISDSKMQISRCIINPWQLTETCSLTILTTFLFLRIHFLLKLAAGISIATFYAWNVWDYRSFIFQSNGDSWNPHLGPQLAHILTIAYMTFSLHLIDRQSEYLNRLDYQWKRQLTTEQDEAFHTRNANKLLLRNILPEHVAEFYLNMDRTEENALYHEAHDHVAVMFATLTDLSIDESNILIDFNELICHFDKLLFESSYMSRIEKIKLAGTTYMAACGLEISRRNSTQSTFGSNLPNYNVVQVMVEFAADMIAILENIKLRSPKPYKLRIGVSHGEVTAGVVGAQKPLYDIWGDAVNMASRMDTTGVAGKIQVTKATAQILEDQGIRCHLRGETYVKPKGLVTTYFVALTDRMELERCLDNEDTSL